MLLATWNVNGIRKRFIEVARWAEEHRPDVFCLQEIKAAASQVPEPLTGLPDYFSFWHGAPTGYAGVSVHVRRSLTKGPPAFSVPELDVEKRMCQVDLGELTIASVYVPNGARNYPLKITFLRALAEWVTATRARGQLPCLCGDLNVTRTDADVHPRMRKPESVGQSSEERALLEQILGTGLVDVVRELHPRDTGLYTWWPPWRDEKAKNRGWRLDYVLLDPQLARRVERAVVLEDVGTSDHAPVMVDLSE